ncbi:MAG: alpha/beta hydrolase fold protein [Bradyrhizobium sp.]|nr:alpha/beta hydrolase fold protein [Bradyrhizobium sp.]
MESRYLRVDGAETHYFEGGQGSPVVLLHGGDFGGRAENSWGFNMAAFAARHRVIAPDWLGFGRTDKIYDFANGRRRVIDHMAAFLAALDVTDAHFVGNSMGATILVSAVAAGDLRFRPRSMVVTSGGGFVPDNAHRRALLDYDCTWAGMVGMLQAIFTDSRWWTDKAYVQQRLDWTLEPGVWETCAAARLKAPHLPARASYGQPDNTRYENIDCPTLIVAGDDDKLRLPGYAAILAERIPRAELKIFEKVGHCPNIECAEAFNATVLDFLERVEGGGH